MKGEEALGMPNICVISINVTNIKQAQVVLGIETDSWIETIAFYKEKGIEMIYDTPQKCPPGYFSACNDPFGNVIELLE